jgi:hypothetical protein
MAVLATLVCTVVPCAARAQTSHPPTKSTTKSKQSHSTSHTKASPSHAARAAARKDSASATAGASTTVAATSSVAGVIVPGGPAAGALASNGQLTLRDAPDGKSLATIGAATPVTPLTRDRGWVRVQVEGWVKDDGLAPANATVGALSAADLRADPQKARGAVVRWDVQVLALAHADVLHKDLTLDEPYLLARGPGSENAMLYIAIPPALVQTATSLTALAPVTASIVASVRNGKSAPLGVPILDAQSLTRR